MPRRVIEAADIDALAMGAALLGAGGGGDPHIGKLIAQGAIAQYGPVELIGAEDLPDDGLVIPTAMMGAPTIMVEKIPGGDEQFRAMRALEEVVGARAVATMPVESGGINSTIPFTVAAMAHVPVVDADGMGRAFPELQMESFHVYGVQAAPMALFNERGDSCLVNTVDNYMLEHVARGICVRMGGVAHVAAYGMRGHQVKATAIPRTISLAIGLGHQLLRTRRDKSDPLAAIRRATEGTGYGTPIELFRGKVCDVERRTEGGFVRGAVTLVGLDDYVGSFLRVEFQNENLAALRDEQLVATVPDIIALLDVETGQPITTEGIRYGYRLVAVALPVPAIMRTDAALQVWGPRAFGYSFDFRPAEELRTNQLKSVSGAISRGA